MFDSDVLPLIVGNELLNTAEVIIKEGDVIIRRLEESLALNVNTIVEGDRADVHVTHLEMEVVTQEEDMVIKYKPQATESVEVEMKDHTTG